MPHAAVPSGRSVRYADSALRPSTELSYADRCDDTPLDRDGPDTRGCCAAGRSALKNVAIFVTAATLVIGVSVACSSGRSVAKPKAGALPPGTAQLTISGKDVGTAHTLQCASEGWLTTITIGDSVSGATVVVSKAEEPAVESVIIRNLNDFTGNYNRGLDGDATVSLTGATYDITGVASGHSTKSYERTTEPFTIKAAC
jgi:lipoprotein LpqH